MNIWTASEYAYKNGYEAGKSTTIEQVFEKLKVDLKGYIGLNYLDDLKEKYKKELIDGTRD